VEAAAANGHGARQMRQPRLAEMVAGALRERIVGGELADGDMLPGLEKLVVEFGVSPPSLREALRILENEGLITVRRGNVGGAVVHRPKADAAAYMFGLVLQAEHVPVTDLTVALSHLEAVCVTLCATRPDRRKTVVPRLRALHQTAEAAIEDAVTFERACHDFHDGLIVCSGNQSIVLAVKAFELLWREQQEGWAHRVSMLHQYPQMKLRRAGLQAHAAILEAIERGDAEEAARLTREHLQKSQIRNVIAQDSATVRATDMGHGGGSGGLLVGPPTAPVGRS
jgi:GntR family transcriptional repressor for pyruvate dehydrogenase complex